MYLPLRGCSRSSEEAEMKLTFAVLLLAASALAQQPDGTYGPRLTYDVTPYDVPKCDLKYEFVGVVMDENVVPHNVCMPRLAMVKLREWDELQVQFAELQKRVKNLETTDKRASTAA